ncbi:MAG: NADH-quinone oxidoreductase subunit M [Candidatus Eisenbacteria bacterium]|nr:NADH-quinone oxidoreductase subunit M [Candidatus Eisenbacteria bacterium]
MILTALIAIPLVAGTATWLLGSRGRAVHWIALAATLLECVLVAAIAIEHANAPAGMIAREAARLEESGFSSGPGSAGGSGGGWADALTAVVARGGAWMLEEDHAWIPRFGIRYHLGIDGLSLVLIGLSALIGVVAVLVSWREITRRPGLFHTALLFVLAGLNGVFLALDLFLFYFFWEVMLVPMYFLIGAWGHERRIYAAVKFFLFTLASGLLMLVAILGLYIAHGRASGNFTFDYAALVGGTLIPGADRWLMLGFLAAFLVKLPVVPLHTWLPDAHSEAPTAGSVVLAALLLKTGAYGILRFVLPFFPRAAAEFATTGMLLGVIGILYGAALSFAQRDLKRLVAYTSVSHMGFVMLGAFAGNQLALQGTVLQMLAHGISTGALFAIAGMLYERVATRDLDRMGGFWNAMPRMGGLTMVFVMASLGLPGLGNFVAEILILLGAFRAHPGLATIAAVGMVAATIYSLALMQRVFLGALRQTGPAAVSTGASHSGETRLVDLRPREMVILAVLTIAIVWLGLVPQPFINVVAPALHAIGRMASAM